MQGPPVTLTPEDRHRIWEVFLTTSRTPEDIAREVPGATPEDVRFVLRNNVLRPSPEAEDALLERFAPSDDPAPGLYASPGVLVSEIARPEDAESGAGLGRLAIARLRSDLARAEEEAERAGRDPDLARIEALRARIAHGVAVVEALAERRKALRAEDGRRAAREGILLDIVGETEPDAMRRAVEAGRKRHPEAFSSPGQQPASG